MEEHYSWMLGDDDYCETCGTSYNEAVLELWDADNNVWQLSYTAGCYGGESVMSDSPEWNAKTGEIIATLKKFEKFNKKEKKELESLLSMLLVDKTK